MTKESLLDYTRQLLYFAINNNRQDIINLLRNKGISVPDNIDTQSLHAVVLKIMAQSTAFKSDLLNLLSEMVMQHEYYNTGKLFYASAEGGDSLGEIAPSTVNSVLEQGVELISDSIKQGGDLVIVGEVTEPTRTKHFYYEQSNKHKKPESSTGHIAFVILATAAATYFSYLYFKQKQ